MGTQPDDIAKYVREGEELSQQNWQALQLQQSRVDEMPTSAIIHIQLDVVKPACTAVAGLLKEIVCDLTCHGRPIHFEHGLKIIVSTTCTSHRDLPLPSS